MLYERGKGVSSDLELAIHYYSIAAEAGFAHAQHNLGACLVTRSKDQSDLVAAAHWFHKGAERGLRLSMKSLSIIYRDGQGVEKNLATSRYWMEQFEKTVE